MIRIVFIVHKPAQFDVPFFRSWAQHQPQIGWQVRYLWAPQQAHADADTGAPTGWGFSLTEGYTHSYDAAINTPEAAAAWLQQVGATHIISNGYQGAYAPWVVAGRRLGLPMALRIDSVMFGKSRYNLWLRRLVMPARLAPFSALLTTGSLGHQYLRWLGIAAGRIGWFPYGTDNDWFARQAAETAWQQLARQWEPQLQQRTLVLGVCKLVPRENPMALLEAFLAVQAQQPNLCLVILGEGPLRPQLEARLAAHPEAVVFLPGHCPYPLLRGWYARARVLMHAAANEPWGVSLQEAMPAGCTLVASAHVGSAADLVVPGQNGYTYPPDQPGASIQALLQALALPQHTVATTHQRLLQVWNYQEMARHLAHWATTGQPLPPPPSP